MRKTDVEVTLKTKEEGKINRGRRNLKKELEEEKKKKMHWSHGKSLVAGEV